MFFVFWLSFCVMVYAYVIYPAIMAVMSIVHPRPVLKQAPEDWPSVTILLVVRNEEKLIKRRLQNLLEVDYPSEAMEIVVVSDGSRDATVDVVQDVIKESAQTVKRRICILELPAAGGKAAALNVGMGSIHADIVVFADARQTYDRPAIRELVANFTDPRVGAVSGELIFLKSEDSQIEAEMGAYWSYEKWVRKTESLSGSVVGATGAIYSIRRSLFRPLPPGTILDDVLAPANVVQNGYRCVFDCRAIAYDVVSQDIGQEWRRKVRTLAGNWQLMSICPKLLIPGAHPLWFRFTSHKVFRLLAAFALGFLLLSSLGVGHGVYAIAAALQFGFYGLALLGAMVPVSRKFKLASFSLIFVTLHAAAIAGLWCWLSHRTGDLWNSAPGGQYPGQTNP